MIQNNHQETLSWYKRVTYYKNTFVGDLFIFNSAIYYVPVADRTEFLKKISPPFSGNLGIIISIPIILSRFIIDYDYQKIQLSPDIKNNWQLEQVLDTMVAEAKAGRISVSSSIKPLKFAKNDIKNIRLGLGMLKFDTEYDDHDFDVGLKRQRIKKALMANGYLS